jgi:hypothetical protein
VSGATSRGVPSSPEPLGCHARSIQPSNTSGGASGRSPPSLPTARIRRLYYGAADPKGGAVENGVRYFSAPTCLHRPEVYGGIGESEAAALLRNFFVPRRQGG